MAKTGKKIDEADELKAFKAARTPKEMVESWGLIQGGNADKFHEVYKVYEEKAPHLDIIKTFIQDPEIAMMERGILDPKGKELAKLTLALHSMNNTRITSQVVAAKARGATDEEIMDTVWLTVFSAAKGPLSNIGQAVQQGWERADALKIKEKLEAARKEGKEYIIDPDEELKMFKSAKTREDMIATWDAKLGVTIQEGLDDWANGIGVVNFFKAYVDRAPKVRLIEDFMFDQTITFQERTIEGHAVDWKMREYIWWVGCAQSQVMGCVTAHVAHLLARGTTEEEIMELLYLTAVESAKTHMEKAGPALAEGFRQAAEIGL